MGLLFTKIIFIEYIYIYKLVGGDNNDEDDNNIMNMMRMISYYPEHFTQTLDGFSNCMVKGTLARLYRFSFNTTHCTLHTLHKLCK